MMAFIVVIRDFIRGLGDLLLSVVRILFMSKYFLRKVTRDPKSIEAVILGNGPSLNQFLKEGSHLLNSRSIFAVNYFARTKEYIEIKPDYYVICSPEHFLNEEKKEFAADRKLTFKTIAEKTHWKMQLIVPSLAKRKKDWQKEISTNPYISIVYMNTTPIEGFKPFRHFFFSKHLGMPRPHNVLIPSILVAINLKFSKIYLAGSDHSWLKEIVVDEDNEVLISQKHFYDKQTQKEKIKKNKPTPQPMYLGTTQRKRKLHEVLEKFYISFQSYWTLKEYAQSRKVRVFNFTKDSYIDAFEKIIPENIK